jgi:hypothetical protein
VPLVARDQGWVGLTGEVGGQGERAGRQGSHGRRFCWTYGVLPQDPHSDIR